MKWMDSMKKLEVRQVLRPEIAVPAVYLIFLGFAVISFRIDATSRFLLGPEGHFAGPTAAAYIISLLGILILAASAVLGGRLKVNLDPRLVLVLIFPITFLALYLALPVSVLTILGISLGFPILLLVICKRLDTASLTIAAFFLACLFALSILYQGVPIVSASLRDSTAVAPARALFHGFAVFAGALLIAYYEKRKAIPGVLFLCALGVLSGFKSDAVAVLISASITGLLLGRISTKEVASAFAIVALILTAVSTHIAGISYASWKIPPALYIFYRAGLTFSVFNRIVEMAYPLGYLMGGALLDPSQRIVSTTVLPELYAKPHIITSTLFGPGMLDFGLLGIALTALFIGGYLGFMYRIKEDEFRSCLYAIALTHSFILVEVGLQLTSILFYLSLLYLALARKER